MASVVLYFQVHQPLRLKPYDAFGIGADSQYFALKGTRSNREILKKVAAKCYLPANKLMLALLKRHKQLKVTYGISGLALEQFEEDAGEVLESFKDLVRTGRVELLAETYYHSLAAVFSEKEFKAQVRLHEKTLDKIFNYRPKALRNTELIYNNQVARWAKELGYKTVLAEGVERYLGWRSPNFVYRPKGVKGVKVLLKNYRLSDDVAFRFSDRDWREWPLSAEKYTDWINQAAGDDVVNIFMDYETFGEHQWAETGIFEFLENLPKEILSRPGLELNTVSQAAERHEAKDVIDMPEWTSWADSQRDLSAWLDNPMQQSAAKAVFELESELGVKNDKLADKWRKLQASDHFYYMSTKGLADGEVHRYFSPYRTPVAAYVDYINVLHDLRQRVYTRKKKSIKGSAHV